jgi:hypothetical protein
MERVARYVNRRGLVLTAWVVVALVGLALLRVLIAPDACLDRGGSFDYGAWRCDWSNDHSFIDVPVWLHAEFWGFVTACIVALVVSRGLHASVKA